MGQTRCLAVMYHYVRDRSGTSESAIRGLDPTAFIHQIDALCDKLEPIDWPSLHAWKNDRATIPEETFLLTFDDGLSDHAEIVAPILESRGLRGVFFVSTGPLVTGRPILAHAVHVLLARLGADRLRAEVDRWVKDSGSDTCWDQPHDGPAARRMYHYEPGPLAELKYLLAVRMPSDVRQPMIDALLDRHSQDPRELVRRWYVSPSQMADMQRAGHTIGGHGHWHEPCRRMTPAATGEDMAKAASVLDDVLGRAVRPFSYPYGAHDRETIAACEKAGFVQAFTTEATWIQPNHSDFALPRCDTTEIDALWEKELQWTHSP